MNFVLLFAKRYLLSIFAYKFSFTIQTYPQFTIFIRDIFGFIHMQVDVDQSVLFSVPMETCWTNLAVRLVNANLQVSIFVFFLCYSLNLKEQKQFNSN